jgi:hypothetical protein
MCNNHETVVEYAFFSHDLIVKKNRIRLGEDNQRNAPFIINSRLHRERKRVDLLRFDKVRIEGERSYEMDRVDVDLSITVVDVNVMSMMLASTSLTLTGTRLAWTSLM